MKDGIIKLDSLRARELGFTSDRFDGYLWKKDKAIIISFIVSRQRGNFRSLVERILSRGWAVKVPTPLGRMREIVKKNGYVMTVEPFDDNDPTPCEVWTLKPK